MTSSRPRILLVAALGLLVGAGSPLAAQSAGETSTVPASEASEFLGRWALELDAGQEQGEMNVSVDIRDEEGQVVADVTTDMAPQAARVTRISRSDEGLVMGFTAMVQGQPFPVEFTLTPAGENMTVDINAGQGTFVAEATATPVP